MAKVLVSGPMRDLFGNRDELIVEGDTVLDIICSLTEQFPAAKGRLLREGTLSMQTVISVNNRDIRLLDHEKTKVDSETRIHLLPSLVGG
jgi:molybdopterin converting factor small subunit